MEEEMNLILVGVFLRLIKNIINKSYNALRENVDW